QYELCLAVFSKRYCCKYFRASCSGLSFLDGNSVAGFDYWSGSGDTLYANSSPRLFGIEKRTRCCESVTGISQRKTSMMVAVADRRIELLAKFFHGFSDSSRLLILSSLRNGPLAVGDIVATTNLSQSNVSNHLACLRNCGHVV